MCISIYDKMVIELIYDDQVSNLPVETLHQDFEVQNSLPIVMLYMVQIFS